MTLDGAAALKFLLGGQSADAVAVLKAHFAFYGRIGTTWRKRTDHYPPLVGRYTGGVVYDYFLSRKKRFSDLPSGAI